MRLAAVVVLVAVLAWSPSTASAHAALVSATPAAGALVQESPAQIVLQFSEPVDVVPDAIRLVDSSGTAVALGDVTQPDGPDTLAADVPPLAGGTYIVAWSILSTDSHPITAAYTFSVGFATEPAPGLIDSAVNDRGGQSSAGVLGAGRWASFAGLAIVLGVAAVLAVCGRELIGTRRSTLVLTAGTVLGLAGTATMILAQADAVTGSAWLPSGWRTVLDSTSGRWWGARFLALPIAAGAFAVQSARQWRPTRLPIIAALGALLSIVYASGGHAATGRARTAGFVSTVVHLGAMSVWIGGLAVVLLVARRPQVWSVAVRFSVVAIVCVTALALTGGFQAWRQLDGATNLVDTVYGRWLVVKVTIIVVLLLVAVVTRRRLRVGPVGDAPDEVQHRALGASLRRIVAVEASLMALVLGATAGLVNAVPPASTSRAPVSVTVTNDGFLAQIVVDPPVTGGTVLHVYVNAVDGRLLQPDEVAVQAALPAQQLGPLTIPTYRAGPDHVTTPDANFPIAGTWTLTINLRYNEFEQVTFSTDIAIE